MEIEKVVNLDVPDEYKAHKADVSGEREGELTRIYTALFSKMIQISPKIRATSLYIHENDPYLLEMIIETKNSGMLIKMQQAITYEESNNEAMKDCILGGNAPDTFVKLGEETVAEDALTRRQEQYANEVIERHESGYAPIAVQPLGFYAGPYGLALPAVITEQKYRSDNAGRYGSIERARVRNLGNQQHSWRHQVLNHEDDYAYLRNASGVPWITMCTTRKVDDHNRELERCITANVVSTSKNGLVYERDHDVLEGFDVAVLYECELNNVNSQLKRVHRIAPSGWLEFHVQAKSKKIRHGFRVRNEPGHGPQDNRATRGKLTPIYKKKGDFSLAGKIDYKTWHDTVKSKEKARKEPRVPEFRRTMGLEIEFSDATLVNWDREVIGLTNSGQLVFGYARVARDGTYEYALLKMGHPKVFDSSELMTTTTLPDSGTRPESERAEPSLTESDELSELALAFGYEEPPQAVPNESWLEAARIYCAARDQTLDESNVKSVFTAYVNSGAQVTEEDLKDFSRLTG